MKGKLDSSQRLPGPVLTEAHLLQGLDWTLPTMQPGLSLRQLIRKIFHLLLRRSVGDDDGVLPLAGFKVVGGAGHLPLTLTKKPRQRGHVLKTKPA